MSATRDGSYFEGFAIGDVFHHRRGRTVTQEDNARWSLATMNTAQAHWNTESMKTYLGGQFDRPILNAAVVLALGVGLTSEDLTENIIQDLGIDRVRMQKPTFPEDTLMATSIVVALDDLAHDPRCGRLDYEVEVRNQHNDMVCSFVRSVLIKKAAYWRSRDEAFVTTHWPVT